MATYMIAGETFTSKKQIEKRIQSIANTKNYGEEILGQELAFMLDFLEQFEEEWEEKKGPGFKSLHVIQNSYGSTGFMLYRVDGTPDDFGWKDALYGITHEAKIKKVLRNEIKDQKFAAKDEAFEYRDAIICPIAKILFSKDQAEVDHQPTFASLIASWAAENSINIGGLSINKGKVDKLTNRTIARSWQGYHLKHATLRVLSKQGHFMVTHNVS